MIKTSIQSPSTIMNSDGDRKIRGSMRLRSWFFGSVAALLVITSFVMAVVQARAVVSAGLRNIGGVLLVRDMHSAVVMTDLYGSTLGNKPIALQGSAAFYQLAGMVQQPNEWPSSTLSLAYLMSVDSNAAIGIMQRRSRDNSADELNLLHLAEAYEAKGQLVKALSAYEQILGRLEKLPETDARIQSQARVRQRIANDQFYLGRSYAKVANYDGAIGYLRAALKERHNDAFATYYLLVSYSELGQDENIAATRQTLQQVRFDWEDDVDEQCSIIADLLKREVWSQDLALRMLAACRRERGFAEFWKNQAVIGTEKSVSCDGLAVFWTESVAEKRLFAVSGRVEAPFRRCAECANA